MKLIKRIIYNYSKKIGDKTGIDLPYYVENGFWVIINQIVAIICGLTLSVIFARFLSKENYGQYQLILSVLAIVSIFSVPGLNISVIRSVARGFDGSYKKAVRISFNYSFFAIPLLWIISGYFYYKGENELCIALLISSAFFPLLYAPNTWAAFLKGKSYFNLLTKRNVIQTVLKTSILIGLAIFFSDNIYLIIIGYLIGISGFNIFWYQKSKMLIKNNNEDEEVVSYGWFITKLQILSLFVAHFDKIIIGFFSIEVLAVYAIALKMLDIIKSISKSFFSITFPKFAKGRVIVPIKYIIFLLLFGLLISLFLYYSIDFIVLTLFTEKFSASSEFFKKIIWIATLYPAYFLLVQKVSAQKKEKKLLQLRIISPILSIIIPVLIFVYTKDLGLLVLTRVYINFISSFIILIIPSKKS